MLQASSGMASCDRVRSGYAQWLLNAPAAQRHACVSAQVGKHAPRLCQPSSDSSLHGVWGWTRLARCRAGPLDLARLLYNI